jgi:N-hydroxyarylamine O-acetyltransferase
VVELDCEKWFFDVGVGGYSLTAPIRWRLHEPQETPHETRRIIEEEGRYFHQVWTGSIWQDVYEFLGDPMPEIDRQVANWWTSTNPNSKFSQNLFVAIAQPDGTRKGLANRKFIHRRGPEILRETEIATADALLEVLSTEFGLHFPSGTRFGSGERAWPTE